MVPGIYNLHSNIDKHMQLKLLIIIIAIVGVKKSHISDHTNVLWFYNIMIQILVAEKQHWAGETTSQVY